MLSTLAHSSLAAPAPAKFHTIPLVKRPLTIKKLQTMERSAVEAAKRRAVHRRTARCTAVPAAAVLARARREHQA